MKKTLVVLACLLALAIGATAQENLDFANLPLVSSPVPLPSGYGNLNWSNFFYVDPFLWSGAGDGYKHGPGHGDVAFIGGQSCGPVKSGCYGIITSQGGRMAFQAISAILAAGSGSSPTHATVLAYSNGNYVGSVTYNLTDMPQLVKFPASWEAITEMQIQVPQAGALVLYDLSVYTTGG